MKKFLCACLAMLVLLCGAAMAEHFRCELPEGAWLGDTTPLREGDALLLAGGKALYRVSLADGSAEKLADMPDNVMHSVLRRDAEGQLTLTGIGVRCRLERTARDVHTECGQRVGIDVALGCARSVG